MRLYTILFFVIILFFFLCRIYGDEPYKIENINFIPPRYYVGDEVELKIKISVPESITLSSPPENKETEWIEITAVHVLPFRLAQGVKTHDISIFFKAFKPGTLNLPSMNVGDIELANLEIHTSSVFEDNKDAVFAPFRSQLHLPDTWAKLILITLLVVLIPLFLFLIIKYILKQIIKKGATIQLQLPYATLSKKLKKLKKRMKSMNFRTFYISLSEIFRNYLQRRLSIPALTSTTREISLLARYNVLERELSDEILKILSLSDFIKFGEQQSSESEMLEVIQKIIFIAQSIEEEKKSVEP